jgi:hypothetical protein
MWLLGEVGVKQNNKYQKFIKWFTKQAREIQDGYKKNALFKKRQIKKK